MMMFIISKNKYLSNDMKIFGTCSIPLRNGATSTKWQLMQKTKCMILTTTQRFIRLNVKELNITIGNKRLDQVITQKTPRYQNRFLSWKDKINKVHSRVSITRSLPANQTLYPNLCSHKILQCFHRPHLEYCSIVWGCAQTGKFNR